MRRFSSANVRAVKRTLALTLGLNLLVAASKLVVGELIGSISMIADGFHSLTDSASNVIGLIGVSWAARPADEDHPYGHWKFEIVATLLVGGLLTMSAWEILRGSFARLTKGGAPEVGMAAFAVMGATMLVNLMVAAYEHRQGRKLGSELLVADAAHTRSDFFVSLAVVVSLVATRNGYPGADVAVALVLAAVIARAAVQILRRSVLRLTDTAVVGSEVIEEIALSVEGVVGVHKVRSRLGPGGGYADLHVQVRPDLRLDRAHAIGHLVADKLREETQLDDVVIHVEPPEGHEVENQLSQGPKAD
ncbi:MAG: cation diffusion facilitator family transporter [Thermoanaerobaculia bacterium]